MATRQTGTVKGLTKLGCFGFITPESGADVFVHFRQIEASGYKSPDEGQRVSFFVTAGAKARRPSKAQAL